MKVENISSRVYVYERNELIECLYVVRDPIVGDLIKLKERELFVVTAVIFTMMIIDDYRKEKGAHIAVTTIHVIRLMNNDPRIEEYCTAQNP